MSKTKEASITIEAVFIVPIIIFVVFSLIYFTFYLHDRVRLEAILERGFTTKSWEFNSSSEEREQEILNYLEQELNRGFFFFKKEACFCEIDGFFISIRAEMKYQLSLTPIYDFWNRKKNVVLERKKLLHNPQEVKRVYEGLQFIIEDIEGFLFSQKYVEKQKNSIEESLK